MMIRILSIYVLIKTDFVTEKLKKEERGDSYEKRKHGRKVAEIKCSNNQNGKRKTYKRKRNIWR